MTDETSKPKHDPGCLDPDCKGCTAPVTVAKAEAILSRYINEKGEVEIYNPDGTLKPGLQRWADIKDKRKRKQ